MGYREHDEPLDNCFILQNNEPQKNICFKKRIDQKTSFKERSEQKIN